MARRGRLILALVALLPACGSILGIDALDVRDTTQDGGIVDGGTVHVSPDGSITVTPPITDGSDGGAAPAAVLPVEKTYAYTATGGDHVTNGNFFNESASYTAATVQVLHTDVGCFTWTITLRANYTETLSFCLDGPNLTVTKDQRNQTFQVGSAQTAMTCMPGDVYFTTAPMVNQSWTHDCKGSNSDTDTSDTASQFEQSGTYTFMGPTTVTVAGSSVPVFLFHVDLNVIGSQTGTNSADWYLSAKSGVLVRLKRDINITYDSPIGTVRYTENPDMTLKDPP